MCKKLLLCVVAVAVWAVGANAQINLNKLQKAAQGAMKQQNSSNKSNSKSDSSSKTWTCEKCNHSGNTGNFCNECGAKKMTYEEKQAAEKAAKDQAEAQKKAEAAAQLKLIEAEEARIDALHFNQKNDPAFSHTSKEASQEYIKKSPIKYPQTKYQMGGWEYFRGEGTFGLFDFWDDYLMPKTFPKKPENIALRELQMHYRPYDETAMLTENRQYGSYELTHREPHCVFYSMDCYASIEMMDYLLQELDKNGFTPTRKPDKYGWEEMNRGFDYKWFMYSDDYFAYMSCRKSYSNESEYMYELAFVPHNMEIVSEFDGVPMPIEGYPDGKLDAAVCHGSGQYWEFDTDERFDGKNKKPDTHWEMHDYEFPCVSLNGFKRYCGRLEKAGFTRKNYYEDDDYFSAHAEYRKGEYTVVVDLFRDKHELKLSATDFDYISNGW